MLGCLHTQNGLTLHIFVDNGDPCEDCSEERNIPIHVYKGIGVVSVINIFLTLNIFSMSLGEARRQYWPSQEIERGYLALRAEFTLVGGVVGSWQNRALPRVFGMLIHPGLSWALGPQREHGDGGSGDGCPCQCVFLTSSSVLPLSPSEWSLSYHWLPRLLC